MANERPKKNQYNQTKISRSMFLSRTGELLTQDNVFSFLARDFSRDRATSRSLVRNANIAPSISATIALGHPG